MKKEENNNKTSSKKGVFWKIMTIVAVVSICIPMIGLLSKCVSIERSPNQNEEILEEKGSFLKEGGAFFKNAWNGFIGLFGNNKGGKIIVLNGSDWTIDDEVAFKLYERNPYNYFEDENYYERGENISGYSSERIRKLMFTTEIPSHYYTNGVFETADGGTKSINGYGIAFQLVEGENAKNGHSLLFNCYSDDSKEVKKNDVFNKHFKIYELYPHNYYLQLIKPFDVDTDLYFVITDERNPSAEYIGGLVPTEIYINFRGSYE